MIKNNRNNEQIYGRNDMIMLTHNNKIYGSLGIADKYVMKTEEGTRLMLSNPKQGKFGDVLTEFNMYGRSEQKQYKGINLLPPDTNVNEYVEVSIPKGSLVFWITDGTPTNGGNFRFFNEDKTESMWFGIDAGITSKRMTLTVDAKYVQNLVKDFDLSKMCLGIGNEPIYEPYVGGKPSPSPDYPQEIKSVGDSGNIEVNVRGKNLVDIYGYSAVGITDPEEERKLFNDYGTTLSTTEKTDKLVVNQEIVDGATVNSYTSGYFCVGINPKLEDGKDYIVTFKINVIQNPFHVSDIVVMFNGIDPYSAQVVGDKVTVKAKYNEFNERQYVEFRIRGMSLEFSNFMITEVGETDDYEPYHEEQTVTLPYTLNAIPVLSGGNYTDQSGQQWICDEINLKRGVKVQRVYEVNVDGENIKFVQSDRCANISVRGLPIALIDNGQRTYGISTFTSLSWFFNAVNGQFLYLIEPDISDKINESCKKQIGKIYYALETPIETALTPAEISAYKELSTKTPTTIIENNYNTWMKATYKSIESV